MRDMEVEKNCRKIERTWQQREKQRQADAESCCRSITGVCATWKWRRIAER